MFGVCKKINFNYLHHHYCFDSNEAGAYAFSKEQYDRFIGSGSCPNYDLSNANFSFTGLSSAKLTGTNLHNTIWMTGQRAKLIL